MDAFGYVDLKRKAGPSLKSFEVEKDSTSEYIESAAAGGIISYSIDPSIKTQDEQHLIKTYRELSNAAEIDQALQEIVNETLIFDVANKKAVEIGFANESSEKLSESIKKKIISEFDNVYELFDFKNKGADIFRKWYIDGKIYFLKVVPEGSKDGVERIVRIDPMKMKKVTELPKKDADGIIDLSKIQTWFVFSDSFQTNTYHIQKGMKVKPDSVIFVDSGLKNEETDQTIGYLYKSIVPYNNLKLMEDSLLIYRVSRSPERRAFYIDVGQLPKQKAEEYLKSLMNRFKTKLVYDSKTGTILDKKNVLSMVEDFWLPRRDGKGTEIQTLPGAENLGVIQDVTYFKRKLYQSLNVPMSRFDEEKESSFTFGHATEINRDEYRFKKFIDKLRNKFILLFEDLLKTQLVLKKIIVEEDWAEIHGSIEWIYTEDNYFVEFKEQELLNSRLAILQQIDPFLDKYFTREWVFENVLKYSEKEITQLLKELPPLPPPENEIPNTPPAPPTVLPQGLGND